MNVTLLGLTLLTALAGLGYLFNHALARLTFVEFALSNEPPATSPIRIDPGTGTARRIFMESAATENLPATAIALFASNSCVTCVRLVDELGAADVQLEQPLHIYFSGSRPPIPIPGQWQERQQSLFDRIGIPATPYVAVLVDGEVKSHGPVANPQRLQHLLTAAGLPDRLPARLFQDQAGVAS